VFYEGAPAPAAPLPLVDSLFIPEELTRQRQPKTTTTRFTFAFRFSIEAKKKKKEF
jgi:hypothetical protein